MADTVNSHEVKAFIGFFVSGQLVVSGPWSPVHGSLPVELFEPFPGSVASDSGISIATVEKDSVVESEDVIDPVRSLVLEMVVNCR